MFAALNVLLKCETKNTTTPKIGNMFILLTRVGNSEYDQEIPQSQTADNPVATQGRAAQPSQDTRKTN